MNKVQALSLVIAIYAGIAVYVTAFALAPYVTFGCGWICGAAGAFMGGLLLDTYAQLTEANWGGLITAFCDSTYKC